MCSICLRAFYIFSLSGVKREKQCTGTLSESDSYAMYTSGHRYKRGILRVNYGNVWKIPHWEAAARYATQWILNGCSAPTPCRPMWTAPAKAELLSSILDNDLSLTACAASVFYCNPLLCVEKSIFPSTDLTQSED